MFLTEKVTKQITETKYLSTENTWRYRSILRYFFYQYERIKYWLYKEEIFQELKTHEIFHEYTMEQCIKDLDALVEWGNLSAVQDTGKVTSVEAFKNKQFRYELTEYSIEIEKMTVNLENLFTEGGSLETNLLERLKIKLSELKNMDDEEHKTVGLWWSDVYIDFRRLNQNYQGYIRDLYSMKSEEMMKTKAFIVFKDKFIMYLRDFIKSLQQNVSEIEDILYNINENQEKILINKVVLYELDIPRLEPVSKEQILDSTAGKWKNMKEWFLGNADQTSEAVKLFDITNEIIRKITRYALQISESLSTSLNRKEEYKKICQMFLDTQNIEYAHCLSAHVFGIESMRHIQADYDRKTESIYSSIYEEAPYNFIIKPRIRTYREKINTSSVRDKTEEKKKIAEETLEKRRLEEDLLDKYIVDGYIFFDKLNDINTYVRTTFLKWLSQGMVSGTYEGKTETGKIFEIINPDEKQRCNLICQDGTFEMPAYIIKIT